MSEPEQPSPDELLDAIRQMKALLGALEGAVPAEVHRDFSQVVANLQLAYAEAAASGSAQQQDEGE